MRPLWLAFGLLSSLPVPAFLAEPAELGRSVAFFPLVGLVFGAALAGLGLTLGAHLPPLLTGALGVALLALLTGGLHLDGLADTADALGAGVKPDPAARRAKMLEVMRDPRVGAHGATAVALVVLIKASALGALSSPAAVILGPAVGRLAAAALLVGYPSARTEGLGRAFQASAARGWAAAGALPVLGLAAWGGLAGGAALLGGLAVALGLGAVLARRLGGLTGDVYGAAVELAEATTWVILVALSTGW